MRLAAKINAGFAVLVALMLASSGSQLALISRLHAESRDLSRISFETASSSLRLEAQVARLRELGEKSVVLQDSRYAAEAAKVRGEVAADLTRLEALELGDAERRELTRLRELWEASAGAAAPREATAAAVTAWVEGLDAVRGQVPILRSAAREEMATRVAAGEERIERARRNARAAALAGLLAAALISLGIGRSLARPLRRLARGTRAVAEGDFTHRVPPRGGPELAALADDFNAMAAQLSELDQLKKDFVANVSHDLKTPLASIQEATRLLLEGIPGPLADGQRRLLELNLKSGERLFRMLEDLLHLSQLESGSLDYSLRSRDLVELGRAALDELGVLLGGEAAAEGDFPAEPVTVACDGPALLKVLHNLLSNAVKYSPAGSAVGLRIRRLTDPDELPADVARRCPGERYLPGAILEVSDAGPGVPDALKTRIFERFFRADRDEGPQGTGLGLAIAREIVSGHGGELWVEDGAERGSVFRIVLWSQPPAGTTAREQDPPPPSGRRPGGDSGHRGEDGAAEERGAPARAVGSSSSWAAAGLLTMALLIFAGCRPSTPPVAMPGPLELGDSAFESGDVAAAGEAYESYLASTPWPASADRILFRLALMQASPDSPIYDAKRSHELLVELVERFPGSPYQALAAYLLELRGQLEELRDQLEEIKRIDLGGALRSPPVKKGG